MSGDPLVNDYLSISCSFAELGFRGTDIDDLNTLFTLRWQYKFIDIWKHVNKKNLNQCACMKRIFLFVCLGTRSCLHDPYGNRCDDINRKTL